MTSRTLHDATATPYELWQDRQFVCWRYVDNGRIITSAGVSAGLDMSLHVIAKLLGEDSAVSTAKYMEYDWRRTAEPST